MSCPTRPATLWTGRSECGSSTTRMCVLGDPRKARNEGLQFITAATTRTNLEPLTLEHELRPLPCAIIHLTLSTHALLLCPSALCSWSAIFLTLSPESKGLGVHLCQGATQHQL